MSAQTLRMPRKKTTGGNPDPRKPYKFVRIKWQLVSPTESRSGQLAQDFTQYVNDALRMRLEAEGAWPPKPAR